MTTEADPRRRSPISRRVPVPQLRERLELLFKRARHPRIDTVTALDRELGLPSERSFRQNYRPDRPSGIPGDLLDSFLRLFQLRPDELLLPLEDFARLLTATPGDERPTVSWYGEEQKAPPVEVLTTDSGDILFSWPALDVSVSLNFEPPALPSTATREQVALLNLRRRAATRAFVSLQREFRFEIAVPTGRYRRLMGLIEGSQLSCFQAPFELPPAVRLLQIPLDGEPYYFDAIGRHSLWICLFGAFRVSSAEVRELGSEDARTRRNAAERIIHAARNEKTDVVVLRAEFDVVI